MDITKVRSGIHKPTRVHKTRRKDVELLENFNSNTHEDLKDQLNIATILLRKALEYIPNEGFETYLEIEKFLEES